MEKFLAEAELPKRREFVKDALWMVSVLVDPADVCCDLRQRTDQPFPDGRLVQPSVRLGFNGQLEIYKWKIP